MKNIQKYFLVPGLLVLIAGLVGCVNLDPPIDNTQFYILKAGSPNQPDMSGTQVLVRNVGIADYLQNSQIAQRSGPNAISYLSEHRWAGSLDQMIGQIVAEELSKNTPGISASTSVGGNEDLYVDISIIQFDFTAGLSTNLIMEYSVLDAETREMNNRGIISNSIALPSNASIEQTVSVMEKTLRDGLKGLSLGL